MLSFLLASVTLSGFVVRPVVLAATGINEQISFQGKVVNANGTNVTNGNYDFVFKIYSVDTGGVAIWTETRTGGNQVTVTDGIFQVNLGSVTTLPGSVDFNTDNIYLGIEFNSDGEMSPRVRFTAAPYALNAAKVGGLTVTDTTGTLTIPNGKTISFADAFTTTGAFPLTLTSTASTTATLPAGTITLADLATSQTLTNKIIGSTGLTFSGATTDITTGTDESLVIVANGIGIVDIQDATTVDSLTADTGGVSIASGQSYTGAGAVILASAATTALTVDSGTTGALNIGTGNNVKTISLGTGTAGNTINIGTDNTTKDTINIGSVLDDVAISSDSWSITNAGALTVVSCSGCGGGGGTLDSAYTAGNTIGTDSGSNVIINLADVATPTEVTINNLDASGTNALQIDNSTTLTNGLFIEQSAAGTLTNAINISGTAGTITNGLLIADGAGAITNGIQLTGTFTTTILDTPSLDITGAGAITGATGISSTTGTFSSTLAANGGITFDAVTDTVGAFTAAGTINMNANVLENIGNTGTDFVASTGALTLAGVLTANGGISLAGSQSFSASALSYMDLGAIVHNTTAVQGLRLPQAANATPSNPTSGEGYLAWDAGGNQVIYYNGSAWATFGAGGGYNLIKDESTSLTVRTTLAFLGAGVSCADNASQTECTISGGAGSDLQGTYGSDVDGGNVTISLTADDDGLVFTNPSSGGNNLSTFLLQLDQANTTANILALDIIQASNASNAVNLTANAIDGETGLSITTNGLTSGKGISITSSATAFTGNLADVSLTGSNASNTGNVLAVSNTGTASANTAFFVDHRATGTGNLAMRVNDESGDTTPFIIDGNGSVGIGASSIATGGHGAGENLLQIGSATKRGNAVLYGDLEMKGRITETTLTNIVDTFIYDTTTDSDGGAWTTSPTSQQLSWYTETKDDGIGDTCSISTDDRCGDSYFPKKAIIVTTPSALYIFDSMDNSMFMKFDQNTSGNCVTGPCTLGADSNNNPTGVFAINGVVYVGTNGGSGTGMYALDFATDRLWRFNTTNRSLGDKNIANRNTVVTYSANNTLMAIADNQVNDVHGTVIYGGSALQTSSGPLNGGLYVAAATDTGISVVSFSDRRTWDIADNAGDDYNAVYLTRRGRLYALNENTDNLERYGAQAAGGINIDWLFADNTSATPTWTYDDTATNRPNIGPATVAVGTSPDALDVVERGSLADEAADLIYVGTDQGLAEIHDVNIPAANSSMGWSKFYNTTRQTAYMSGNTDGMWMMDDASGDLVNSAPAATNNNLHNVVGTATYGVNGVHGSAITLGNNTMFCADANTDNVCDNDTDYNYGDDSLTIELWFKHTTTAPASGIDVLVSRRFTSANVYAGGYELWMTSTCTISFAMDDDNTTWNDDGAQVTTTQTYCDDQWHHLVASRLTTDGIINLTIDGKTISDAAVASAYADANSPMLTVGGDCSVGAACVTGANFWDGSIDDLVISTGATATGDGTTHVQARKRFLEGKQALENKIISITDASSATSTSLVKTGQTWTPNEFVGQSVEIITGTGAGQTRKIISNTADTLTVYPAFTSTPDTTSDFEVNAERLYGETNTVTAIAGLNGTFLGKSNQVFIGASNGSDGGGVTRLSGINRAEANEYYHSDAAITDDVAATWSGGDADDMTSIDARSGVIVMNSLAAMWVEKVDLEMESTIDSLRNDINSIKGELLVDTILGTSFEHGQLGGADLAEWYYSDEALEPGMVVATDIRLTSGVKKSTKPYQHDVLGVVATQPGFILGDSSDNSYPIALVGRVPVQVTTENGWPLAGERITASSVSGFGMRASQAGRVIGTVIEDLIPGNFGVCPVEYDLPAGVQCGTVVIFVNLTDYYGQSVELAMVAQDEMVGAFEVKTDQDIVGLVGDGTSIRLASATPTREEKIMRFLREVRDERAKNGATPSEVFTDRVAASSAVITPRLIVDEILAKSIKADSIEGLSIWTDQIASLQAKYAGLETAETVLSSATTDSEKIATTEALRVLSADSLTLQLDGSIMGRLSVARALTVGGRAEFEDETFFEKLATFLGETVFQGRVNFALAPTFSTDTAGFAMVEKGARRVRVTFDEPYERQPIVTVSLTNDASPLLDELVDEALKADVVAVEEDYLNTLFEGNFRYLVTEKDRKGFVIVLSEPAPGDLQFSWVAIAVNDAKTFESEKVGGDEVKESDDEPVDEKPISPPGEVSQPLSPTPTLSEPAAFAPSAFTNEEELAVSLGTGTR